LLSRSGTSPGSRRRMDPRPTSPRAGAGPRRSPPTPALRPRSAAGRPGGGRVAMGTILELASSCATTPSPAAHPCARPIRISSNHPALDTLRSMMADLAGTGKGIESRGRASEPGPLARSLSRAGPTRLRDHPGPGELLPIAPDLHVLLPRTPED